MSRSLSVADLKERLRNRQPTFGGWLQIPSPDVAEIVARGFHWVVVDMEHGGVDRTALVSLVRAIQGSGAIALARLMSCDHLLARQALDAGCAGLIIPHVEDPNAFAAFADRCTWPPRGSRSIGFFRANQYGAGFSEHAAEAVDPILVPMVESQRGLDQLGAVLATGRASAVLIGPYDLSASLGAVGDFSAPEYRAAEEHVLATCAGAGVSAGIHDVTPNPASVREKVSRGYTFIACGMDTVFLTEAVNRIASYEELLNAHKP